MTVTPRTATPLPPPKVPCASLGTFLSSLLCARIRHEGRLTRALREDCLRRLPNLPKVTRLAEGSVERQLGLRSCLLGLVVCQAVVPFRVSYEQGSQCSPRSRFRGFLMLKAGLGHLCAWLSV